MAEQQAEQHEVLAPGEVAVDGGELSGEADEAAHRVGLLDDVVPEHPRVPLVGAQEGGEHPDGRRLAAPFGPSTP